MSGTRAPDADEDDAVDEASEESFPASDPPAQGGTAGPNDPPPNGAEGAL